MVRSHLADPYDPSRVGTDAYGHNGEGALATGVGLVLAELAVAYLCVRPWGGRATLVGPAIGMLLFVPWGVMSMMMVMHSGGILGIHFLWTTLVMLTILAVLVARVIRRFR